MVFFLLACGAASAQIVESKGGKATGFPMEPEADGPHPAIVWTHSGGPLNWVADAVSVDPRFRAAGIRKDPGDKLPAFLARHLGQAGMERMLQRQAGAAATVVVISIDGFPAYALDNDKLPIPTLRRLMKEGAWAKRMTIVNPAVTWPNHTTLVTGVDARKHGVLFNGFLMRDAVPPKVEPWVDKEKWVRARTVYDAAFEAGLTTAQVDWVAIYNAKTITWQFPEEPNPDGQIEREMVERGVLSRQDVTDFIKKTNAAWRDEMWTEAAAHIIREHRPNLLLFHLLNLDSVHHEYGPGNAASFAAIAYADSRVQQILDAIEAAGLKERTTVIVVSDHGFKSVKHVIRPNEVLLLAGLGGAATIIPEGGTAMVYRAGDRSLTVAALKDVEGIDRVVEPKDYAALGLPTPAENSQAPDLLLVAKDGYAFSGGNTAGQHGYLNTDPDMDAIFIAWGYRIKPGARADRIRNVDVAPTIAALLGLELTAIDGRTLAEFLAPK